MTITLRDDVAYIVLQKVRESSEHQSSSEIRIAAEDLTGRNVSPKDVLGHLDYLNQQGFVEADFSGDAYGGVDILPQTVTLTKATLTRKGLAMLEKMNANPPESLNRGAVTSVSDQNMPFLEKVRVNSGLPDIFDARDISVVVFRTMRDLMTTDAADRTADELHQESVSTENKSLQNEIADLWKDTNPIVAFLSRVRPPLAIDAQLFMRRIGQEAGLPQGVTAETAVTAVFAATKDELSSDRIQEISDVLPGQVQALWDNA